MRDEFKPTAQNEREFYRGPPKVERTEWQFHRWTQILQPGAAENHPSGLDRMNRIFRIETCGQI